MPTERTQLERDKMRGEIIEIYETAIGIARLKLKFRQYKEAQRALDDACDEIDKLTGWKG